MDAERAYLFRHAVLRDASYQLQLPTQRAELHALALELLELLFAGSTLEPVAEELAHHAHYGSMRDDDTRTALGPREVMYLRMAAAFARDHWRNDDSARLAEKIAGHPHASPEQRIEAWFHAGLAMLGSGDFVRAGSYFERSGESARQAGNGQGAARADAHLAQVRQHAGKSKEAEALFHACLKVADELPDPDTQIYALRGLVVIQEARGDYDQARANLERALELTALPGQQKKAPILLRALGANHHDRARYTEAEELYNRALKLARASGNIRVISSTLSELGALYDDTDRPEMAEAAYLEGLALATQAGNRVETGILLGNMANLYVALKRFDEAERCYEQGLELFSEAGQRTLVGRSYQNRGVLRMEQDSQPAAREDFRLAMEIFEKVGNRRAYGETLGYLAESLSREGRYAEALEHALAAIEIHKATQHARGGTAVAARAAVVMLRLGRVEEGKNLWESTRSRFADTLSATLVSEVRASMNAALSTLGLPPLNEDGSIQA